MFCPVEGIGFNLPKTRPWTRINLSLGEVNVWMAPGVGFEPTRPKGAQAICPGSFSCLSWRFQARAQPLSLMSRTARYQAPESRHSQKGPLRNYFLLLAPQPVVRSFKRWNG